MDSQILYFINEKLLCESNDGVHFDVLNGAWNFKLKNNIIHVNHYKKYTVEVKSLVKYTRKEFNEKYPNFGY